MPHANVNGVQIYYEVHGSGEPILFIPGLGSDIGTWATVLPALPQYQAILIENRGSGRSSKPPGRYSTELMAEDAVGVLDHLKVERAHVVAKSMGAMIAQHLAAKYPERVRLLVLACTLMRHDGYGEELLELGRIVAEKSGLYETYRLAFLISYSREYCMKNRSRLEEAKRLLAKVGSAELLHGYVASSLACQIHDSRESAARIKAPTLVLAAEDDAITTAQQARELANTIPGAELRIMTRGKHGFWREFPEEVNPIVVEFLSKHS